MQTSQQPDLQKRLLDLKADLLNKSQAFREGATESLSSKGDEADHAACEVNLNLSLRLQEREFLLVQKIDYALNKLSEGRLEECDDCGAEIESKRLMARPYTTLCIACKEEQEHQRRFFA